MIGPDHKSSLLPNELKEHIKNIRKAELMMGSMEKKIQERETNQISNSEKYFFKKNVIKNSRVKKQDLIIMRPSNSIKPKFFYEIINKKAKKNLFAYTSLKKVISFNIVNEKKKILIF